MKIIFKSTGYALSVFFYLIATPLYICFVAIQVIRCCRHEIFFVKLEDSLS